MRSLISMFCGVLMVSLLVVSPVEAKGGRGGGGGNRGGGGGGRGGQQGGPKFSGQQQARGGGANKQTQSGGPAATDKHTDKQSDKLASKPNKKTTTPDAGKTTEGTEAANKKQKQLEIAQRQRDKRLAQADHLREIAERNGNQNLADNADRMEAQAHELYQQRGNHLNKLGVTDPALDPGTITDPGGLTDPGVIDPLNDPALPELLPGGP
jgi:hypothetical protein